VQELLNNAIKYSKASKVELLLTHKSDWVLLKVKDDGVGVPNDLVNELSIRERVLSLNGKIAIENLSVGIETQIFLPI
jgi:signal transduction histidine kinase